MGRQMDAEFACVIAVLRPSVLVAHEVIIHRCLAVEASAWSGVIFSVGLSWCVVGDFWTMCLGTPRRTVRRRSSQGNEIDE